MAHDHIVVDGSDDRAPGTRSESRARLGNVSAGVIGLLIGLAATLLLVRVGATSGITDTQQTSGDVAQPAAPPTVPATLAPSRQEVLGGIPDILVASGLDRGGGATIETWRPDAAEPGPAPLPIGDYATDPSGRWLSVVSEQRYGEQQTLWVGNDRYVEPISTGALDAIWSSSDPGRIAWAERTDGGNIRVRTEDLSGDGEPASREQDLPVVTIDRLAWLTPESLTVEIPGRGLTVVTPSGELIQTPARTEFLAGTDLFALVRIDGHPTLVNKRFDSIAGFVAIDGCRSATFAPPADRSRRRVALLCDADDTTDLVVLEIGIGLDRQPSGVTTLGELPMAEATSFTWADGDRYVVSLEQAWPSSHLTAWDLETGEVHGLDWRGSMTAIHAVAQR